jgi:prepilin-type processing-associated H-X9-DG protein
MEYFFLGFLAFIGLIVLFSFAFTVQQGTVAVVTRLGSYARIARPGLNFKIPFLERVFRKIPVQNRSAELSFQATTIDQANVHFTAMLLFAVVDDQEETIKNVAFKFVDEQNFMQALVRSVEGSVRAFVATKRQAQVLALRREIVEEVKTHLDKTLFEWGYHLIDLQVNDIAFDEAVTQSMAKVVASNNLRAAAENEGQALLITKTKSAEAEGNAIKIAAEAEREAAKMRGQAVALFREEVAKGMKQAALEMQEVNMDSSVILFSMWTEALKNFVEHGKGNVIFLDGSVEGVQKTLKELMSLQQLELFKPMNQKPKL